MRKIRALFLRFWRVVRRSRQDQDFAEELQAHLQMHIEDNVRSGMTAEQARREALIRLGGIEATTQAYRERNALPFLDVLFQDLRYTLRQLRKNPGFAITALLVLTLGMCATIAIFSFVDAALIKPLPYRDPSRLAVIFGSIPLGQRFHLSFPDYYDFKRLNKSFTSFEVYDSNGFMLTTPTGTQMAPGARVSAGFFRVLGVKPILGRDFSEGEDKPSAPRMILLSYATWRQRFGGRSDVLGQTVTLDGNPNTIVGVLPANFHFAPAEPAEFWAAEHDESPCRGCHWLFGLGRLKDGVTFEAARAEMSGIAKQLEQQYPTSNNSQGAFIEPLTDVIVGDIRPIMLAMLGGAALLLLIATVNVASLLLVRSENRKREVAVRGALGAPRGRLLRQFVTEGLALSVAASAFAVIAADATMNLLTRLVPKDILAGMPYLQRLGLTPHVLLFSLIISLFSAALFSFTPMVSLSSESMRVGLTEGGRSSSGLQWRRFGSNLVAIELATAVVLLVAAGLFAKSFYRLLQVDPGLQPHNLALLTLSAPREHYSKDEEKISLERQILDRVAALPGVTSAAVTSRLPVGDGDGTSRFVILGHEHPGEHNEVAWRSVSTSYFKTLGARLLEGRYFTDFDRDPSHLHGVVIINHALARKYFAGLDPIGMRINFEGGKPENAKQIVGIIDDIREGPLDTEARCAFYLPFENGPTPFFHVVARTAVPAQNVLPMLSTVIRNIDPSIATFGGSTMDQRMHDSQPAYLHRASTWIVGSFAAVALLLSIVGLYGVIAYSVSQRTREIGVRMALGAQRSTVYGLVMKEAAWLIAIGLAAGLAGSLAAATLIRNLLFGTKSWDPTTLVIVAVTLAGPALGASFFPAHRAASVNPANALRAE
ncbi:MAG TPA: ABC transporter permease [Terriglobales bacterium]|nr:ABC transporter permease [Terriglobales bacterium]